VVPTQLLDASSQRTEELALIDHSMCLKNISPDHHEQISCSQGERSLPGRYASLRFVRNGNRARKASDERLYRGVKYDADSQ
jgi:hypothetical protein